MLRKISVLGSFIFIIGLIVWRGEDVCWSNLEKLSDEEKIRSVAQWIVTLNSSQSSRPFTDETVLPYKDENEFLQLNPSCCVVGRGAWEIDHEVARPSLPDRILGAASDYVGVRYIERARSRTGVEIRRERAGVFGVTACGTIVKD